MGIIVRIRSDPRACIFALILIMSEVAGARAIVHFAFIVRNGVIELCLCVRFILIDKSLSIHVPLALELLVARVQQDRIGGGAILQFQVGIGSKVKVADIVRIRTRGRMAAVPVMLNACTGIGFALFISIFFLLFEHGNDISIAHVFVVHGSREGADDRFDLGVPIEAFAVHFDVLTLFETGLKLCDFVFQCLLGLLLIGVRNGNCGTGFLDNFFCLDGDGLNGGVIGDVVGHIAVFIAGGAVRIDLDIRIALAFQSCLDLINANAELRGGDCDRDSTILAAVDVTLASNLFQAAIGFAAFLGFGKGEGAIIFGFLPEVPLDLDMSGLTGVRRGRRTYLRFGHLPRNRGKFGVGDVLQIFRSRTLCIRKLIGLSVLGFEALQRAIFVKVSLTVKLKTARNTPEVKVLSKGGFRLVIVLNEGLVFIGPDHGGAGHFGRTGLGVLLGRRSVRVNSGGVFDLFRAADGALFRIAEGVRFVGGGIRPLKLAVSHFGQGDVSLRQARASLMIDGLCQCILQGLVLCYLFGIGLGLLRGLIAVFHLLGVGLLAVVVGDGDTQFEHAAQQSVLLVGHAAHFALIGGIAQLAISVHRVSVAGGILVQQVPKLGVIKAVQLRVGLVLCDGIGQVVFLVLINEGAVPFIMGLTQNIRHIKGVLLALVVLHSDVGGRIGVIRIFLGAEILGFFLLLACHRDGQGGLGGLGGRAGIHLDGGGLLLTLRVGVLFGQGIGAVAVIRVTGFDQLGNVQPGHFASFNFVFFGQGEFLFAVLFHGVGHSVITELGLGFGIPAQFSAQLLLQGFLHVLRRVFLRLGTGLTLDRGSSFKRGIGGGGRGGRGRTVRVGGGGSSGVRLAQHKLRVLGLRLGLFSFANGLFLCLVVAVLGAFLLIVQVGLRLTFLLVVQVSLRLTFLLIVQVGLVIAVLLAIALSLLAVPGGLLRAGLTLFGHIAVHRAGALGGGGRIVLGDLVVVVVVIHADIRVADHIHSALALLVGHRIGRHTGSSNGCRSRAFPFRLGRAAGCVIRDGVHIICRIRDQGLGRNTCGQCHRHCSNFKLFVRHDPRSPFLSPCV